MSYTPGLLVSPHAHYRATRLLPIPGEVVVEVGQRVAAGDVVARTRLPGDAFPSNVAARIGVSPADLPGCLLVAEGAFVREGELIARSPGIFGLMRTEAAATATGTVESVSDVTGQVIIRAAPIPVEVDAYVAGTVARVIEGQGVTVEADVAHVQGIFGVGGETRGTVRVITGSPADDLTADRVRAAPAAGAVLVGGGRVTREAVRVAAQNGAAALVAGGVDDADLRDILGYDLGVAVTGTEQIGLSLIITEGFGDIAMADATFALLRSLEGRPASVNGTTQIRAGVMRPEIVVPLDASPASPVPSGRGGGVAGAADPGAHSNSVTKSSDDPAFPSSAESPSRPDGTGLAGGGTLAVGAPLRVIRDPYFGLLGTVAAMPHEPARLASGSLARVVVVRARDGSEITVPRANVELIEGTA